MVDLGPSRYNGEDIMAVKTYQVDPLLKLNQKRPTPRRSPTRKFLAPDQLIDF